MLVLELLKPARRSGEAEDGSMGWGDPSGCLKPWQRCESFCLREGICRCWCGADTGRGAETGRVLPTSTDPRRAGHCPVVGTV